MSDEFDGLNEHLRINLGALGQCCAEQAVHYAEAARYASAAGATAERAKLARDRVRAETDLRVRAADPSAYGLSKYTESSISAVVATQEEVKESEDYYIQALEDSNLWSGLVSAFEHRRSMLNNEVKLWAGEFFGDGATTSGEREDRAAAMRRKRRETEEEDNGEDDGEEDQA